MATWERWKRRAIAKPPESLSALKREAPGFLERFLSRLSGDSGEADRGGGSDAISRMDAFKEAFDEGGEEGEAAVRALHASTLPSRRVPVAVNRIEGERPSALLRLTGRTGGVLTLGTVAVLSGAGGGGKSALTASLALALASRGEGEEGTLAGALFDAPIGGGPVLMLTWEDHPAFTRWRIEAAAKLLPGIDKEAVSRVHVLDMAGAPLYGPGDRGEASGLYTARLSRCRAGSTYGARWTPSSRGWSWLTRCSRRSWGTRTKQRKSGSTCRRCRSKQPGASVPSCS